VKAETQSNLATKAMDNDNYALKVSYKEINEYFLRNLSGYWLKLELQSKHCYGHHKE